MSAPAFEFTDRATPIVQFGHRQGAVGDALWQRARWGDGRWGKVDWEPPIWTDLTCEIHEITTQTGRGAASDRFIPGTAYIVASNANEVSDIIFPPVPGAAWVMEPVPQPPITGEEDLANPDAGTITSDGWQFTDDFHRVGSRWIFPPAWADSSAVPAPASMFKVVDEAFEPELYIYDVTNGYTGCAAAQWTRNYDPTYNSDLEIELGGFDWPATPSAGTPQLLVDLYLAMNSTTRECFAARLRFVPKFAGAANEIYAELWHMDADGTKLDGTASPTLYTSGTGTNGIFGTHTLRVQLIQGPGVGTLSLSLSGVIPVLGWVIDGPLPAGRVGMWMQHTQGYMGTTDPEPPRITQVTGPDFEDDLTRPLGSGWGLPPVWLHRGEFEMIEVDGAMTPAEEFNDRYGGEYAGQGRIQWLTDFDGNQYIEVDVEGVAIPGPVSTPSSRTALELHTQGNASNLASMVVRLDYWAGWDTDDTYIDWQLYQRGPNNELVDYDPAASGTVNLGPIDGMFPEPQRWRIESDVEGEQRLFYQGALLHTVTAPAPAVGGRIGLYAESSRGAPDAVADVARAPGIRIDRFSGGLQEPLGTEELGMWIRIGVDHQTLGNVWFFRGIVDGVVPTYLPERSDAVRIECIDALGEAGRQSVDRDQFSHEFAAAPDRIRQVLNKAAWPRKLRTIHDDSTIMTRPPSGKAVDALTAIAESCGGAVYGDPQTGDVVFRGQDWQGEVAAGRPVAVIANGPVDAGFDDLPHVCPSGWERSSRRQDMLTRVKYKTESSLFDDRRPLVREWRSSAAEAIYGVEMLERTLLCTTVERLNELTRRQLRLRHPNQFPRIEAVTLEAATSDEALDLMTSASFTIPSKYRCILRRDGDLIFRRNYLVTGIRHTMSPARWTCRLQLDVASALAEAGGRWGSARWQRDNWGRTR